MRADERGDDASPEDDDTNVVSGLEGDDGANVDADGAEVVDDDTGVALDSWTSTSVTTA